MSFWDRVKYGGFGYSGGIKGIFEELGEKAGDTFEGISEKAGDIFEEIGEKTEEKISKLKRNQKENENLFLATSPLYHMANNVYDKQRGKSDKFDKEPEYGALVYCQLGPVEHSGIYIGNREIVHLNGRGHIERADLHLFTSHVTTIDKAIWFPCDEEDGYAIGNKEAGNRAKEMLTNRRKYHLLMDNCHQFCSGCISGDFENANNFLWTVKHAFDKDLNNVVLWKKWNWRKS